MQPHVRILFFFFFFFFGLIYGYHNFKEKKKKKKTISNVGQNHTLEKKILILGGEITKKIKKNGKSFPNVWLHATLVFS
jgi:hypothetical protein